ncbi:MAG TPA: PQQ-binding-like beta-propeller repeat protein [Vicinamibacterales bacterium]|nr:PQQ-binding-like beta-propeller repeat protein [Vicinamibacterales bacterium]
MLKATPLRLIFVAFAATASLSAQWPQWRGPNRDGVVASANVPAAWPETPARVWTQPVGEGYSTPVVAEGRVFVHGRKDPDETVTAFQLATGKPLWTAKYQSTFNKNKYAKDMSKGPFSTPLVSNGRLFTLGTSAVLTSFDVATGQVKWRKDWSKDIDTSKLFTGTSMSPIIDSGVLIVHVGDDTQGAFRALDRLTGAEKWALPGHGPGYASPVMRGGAGAGRHFITMTDKAAVGVHVSTGKLLWTIPFPDEWNENIVTPVLAGDMVVISGTRQGTFGYRVEARSGVWTPTKVWHNTDVPMYMSSPVADGNFVYGFSSKRKGQLFCLDATTGRVTWTTEGRGGTNAALQIAGPNLIVLTTDGDLLVVKRNPQKYEEVRRYDVSDSQTWAQPVLVREGVVVRDANSLALWSLK